MTEDLVIVLGLLAVAVVLFMRNAPQMDVVALIMLTALPLSGVISLEEALSGFSDPNVVLIAALFVIGESLVRTGVTRKIGDWLLAHAGGNERRLVPALMSVAAGVGSIMSSTAVVALFIPVVLRISRRTGIAASRLLMPLSFGALISGMMTLVATAPNLVVSGELVRHGFDGFHFFAFTPFGLAILVLGAAYMVVARRWLAREQPGEAQDARPHLMNWVEEYGLAKREHRLRVRPGSGLVGKPLSQLDLRGSAGVNIVAIERQGRFSKQMIRPTAATELYAEDVLLLDLASAAVDIAEVGRRFGLEPLPLTGAYFLDQSKELGMAEVIIPANSSLIGRTVAEARFRSTFDLTVVGLRRGGESRPEDALDIKLQAGDTLLVIGPWRAIRRLQQMWREILLLGLPAELDDALPAASRAPYALAVVAGVLVLMVSGVVENVLAALLGCLLLGLFGCIDGAEAYRSVRWRVLVLIIGMMPFAAALQKTGGITLAATALVDVFGGAGVHVLLAALFAATAVTGLFISNTATAILMAPVALAVAQAVGASPYPFAMTVALAASAAFMTPMSSPVNALVVTPGNYRFMDFVRIGVPFTLIVLVATVLLVPLLLRP